jgi:hypothetical protein
MPSGVIKINPAVFSDGRAALAVAWNEGLRLWMEDHGYVPVSAPTDEQRQALADTAYADDPEAMAKTVLARIITRDESAPNPTPEQLEEAYDLLLQVADSLPDDDPDVETVMLLANDFAPEVQDDLPELPEIPDEELSGEEMPEEGVPVPEGELPPMPAEGELPPGEGEMPPVPGEGEMSLPAPEMGQEGAIPEGAPGVPAQEGSMPEGAPGAAPAESPDLQASAPAEQGVM